uniref:NADH-ubiquinone oxidoreductase chain 4 n=1 Tax=Ruizia karukerae TaxID=2201929 RepID=A0A343YNA9_9BILA|nr:NADH dehydrogenase subunit 4 [Ruizia karukerae]
MGLLYNSMFLFLKPLYFFYFIIMFSFSMMLEYSWSGLFFVVESYVYIILIFMSIFILSLIFISEKNSNLVILSELLVVISLFFFIPGNIITLYMFFEMSMFPILVMILGYGSQIEKISSAYYLIFYTGLCSFPFLFIYLKSSYYCSLVYFNFFYSWEILFILSMSFMVKFPDYFLHLWLPKAHVEAPTTASMLLAGLLLKLGTAGFLRLLSTLNFTFNNIWILISFFGMLLASLSCLFQSDGKALAAFSSITHMSFLFMSMLLLVQAGKSSSLLMMLAHGYASTLMFYLVGEFYHTTLSRMVYYMNGFMVSSFLMVFGISLTFLTNAGTPPSMSFVSEFITISTLLLMFKWSLIFIFSYFFLAFYYSIFLLTNTLMSKNVVMFNSYNLGFVGTLLLMLFNIFWLSLIF